MVNYQTTCKNYILSGNLSTSSCNNILNELTAAASEDKCVDIATVIRQGAFFVKVTDQPQPSIVHSFCYADGNDVELGYGKRKPFILSGFGNSAFPLSLKPKKMFAKADMNLYPYREILDAESVDQIKAINLIPRTPGINTMTV